MFEQTNVYQSEHLAQFATRVLESFGLPDEDARLAAEILIISDLRGIDSHGIARLASYAEMLAQGRINPRPEIQIVRESPSTATVDGDNGMGLVVGPAANRIACKKAQEVGSGWVGVCNSNHFGIAGYYVLEALRHDLIGWTMTNTTPIVSPLWGAERMLGTNPIAVAFPGNQERPIVIDMATNAAAFGKVEMALRRDTSIPSAWAADKMGTPTSDPQAMVDAGSLLPLGFNREQGGHKGFCLSALVDLLCGPLTGANWGPFTPPFTMLKDLPSRQPGKGLGHFFGAWKIDAFVDVGVFKDQIDDWIQTFRGSRAVDGTPGPVIPGYPEWEAEEARRVDGIPLIAAVVDDLRNLAKERQIAFD